MKENLVTSVSRPISKTTAVGFDILFGRLDDVQPFGYGCANMAPPPSKSVSSLSIRHEEILCSAWLRYRQRKALTEVQLGSGREE